MDKHIKRGAECRRWMPRIYLFILIVMTVLLGVNYASFGKQKHDMGLAGYESMEYAWKDENGEVVDLSDRCLYASKEREFSVWYKIPYELRKSESIVFRTRDCSVKVFIGDRLVYKTEEQADAFESATPGQRWNVITYDGEQAGEVVELRVKTGKGGDVARIDSIYRGDCAAIIIEIIRSEGKALVLSALMMIMGILYAYIWCILNYNRKEKNHSSAYLALFSMGYATWSALGTGVLQFFFDTVGVMNIIYHMAFILLPLPLVLYMDCLYQVFNCPIIRTLSRCSVVYLIVITFLHVMGVLDYFMTMKLLLVSYSIKVTLFVVYTSQVSRMKKRLKDSKENQKFRECMDYGRYHRIGLYVLWITVMLDVGSYVIYRGTASRLLANAGMLIFIIAFGIDNIKSVLEMVKQATEAELISTLAYTDGLTKVGNRTAYMEHLERLASKVPGEPCGIAVFDVNNLKPVNDQYGHAAGDELLKHCTTMLQESFDEYGMVYRTGGDEFAVILSGSNVVMEYEMAIEHLQKKMRENSDVSMAYGVSFCKETTMDNIHRAERDADMLMYQYKYRYKRNQRANVDSCNPIC